MEQRIIRLDSGVGDTVGPDTYLVYAKEQFNADGTPSYKLGKSGSAKSQLGMSFAEAVSVRYAGDVHLKFPIIFVYSLKEVCADMGVPVPALDATGHNVPAYDDEIRKRLALLKSHWTHNLYVKNAKAKGLDPEALVGHTPKLHDKLIEAVQKISCGRDKCTTKMEGGLRDYQVPYYVQLREALFRKNLALLRCFGGWGKSYLALLIASHVWQETKDGYVLWLSPVKDNITDAIVCAEKFAWAGRNVNVRTLSSFKNTADFNCWLRETIGAGEVPFVAATVQDIRGKQVIDDDEILDDEATSEMLKKLHTKYKFLLENNLSLLLRDEIHLHFASPNTLKTLDVLKARKTLDMTATLTGREAATFEYDPKQIVTYSLLHALLEKQKVDGFADIKSLPDLEIRAVTNLRLADEFMKLLDGIPAEQWLASKMFALLKGELAHPEMIVDFVSRAFSLGIWKLKTKKWPFALRVERVQSDTWMLIVPRGDKHGGARQKIDLIVNLLNEQLDEAVFVSGYEMRASGTLEDRVQSLKREPQNLNKPMIIVTHRVLLTGVNIPQLEGIALADKIGSQALFMQTLYRLFRKWPKKTKCVMTCYEPGTEINDLSAALAIGTLVKDHVDGGGTIAELEGLLHISAYDAAGKLNPLGAKFLVEACDAAERKAAERLLSSITEKQVRENLDDETLTDVLLMDAVGDGGSGSKDDQNTEITTGNDGKKSKPAPKAKGDKKDEQAEKLRQLRVIAAMANQAPLLAMNRKFVGVLRDNIDPIAVMADPLVKFVWGEADQKLILRALQAPDLRRWLSDSLQHRLSHVLDCSAGDAAARATGVLGSKGPGQQYVVLDGAVTVQALINRVKGSPKKAMVVNPKAGQLILALQAKFPGILIAVPIVVNKDQDDRGFMPQLEALGATCVLVEGDIECGTIGDMDFDLVIGNPPYKAGMHLQFLELGLRALKKDGQLVFVHPAEWLVQKRDTPKSRKYKVLRDQLMTRGRTEIMFIDNPWGDDAMLQMPLTITDVKPGEGSSFEDVRILPGHRMDITRVPRPRSELDSLDDIVEFGDGKVASSILQKVWMHEGTFEEHRRVVNGAHYVNMALMTLGGVRAKPVMFYDGVERSICGKFSFVDDRSFVIFDGPTFAKGRLGKEVGMERIWLSFATREEAQNCLDFLTRTKFFRAFLALIKIDQNAANNLLRFVPWLDWANRWDDEALNKFFKFTKTEIATINEIVDLITVK
jgi:superfamily II DNA or RNA helicase